MKRKLTLLITIALLAAVHASGQAKYVFLFIGDGMGVNQINATELYLNALEGQLGYGQLCFTQFPVSTVATTFSHNNDVTDSAASGTALATGTKTDNGHLGVDPEGNKLVSIAEMARNCGRKVGIVTTVGVNHATPGAFYAGQMDRGEYDAIMEDLAASGFDFFAGDSYLRSSAKRKRIDDAKAVAERAGYTCVGNIDQFKSECAAADKMVLVPEGEYTVAYGIDRINAAPGTEDKYISLRDIVESAVTFLTKDKKNPGFFLMAEGGKIDYAAHGNDAATDIQEIIDFDQAVRYAYEFYLQHPKETTIIITADHDTGGLSVTPGSASQLRQLENQKESVGVITNALLDIMKEKGREPLSWEEIKDFLAEHLGLWKNVKVNPDAELDLFTIYTNTIAKFKAGDESDEYGYNHNASIVAAAVRYLDNACGLKYPTSGHTSGYVPVYAIGAGAGRFGSKTDNAEISKTIMEIGRYSKGAR